MQFHEKDISRILHACEYYRSIVRSQDEDLASKYDKVIHKIHSYKEEMECPNCWDPESVCNLHL